MATSLPKPQGSNEPFPDVFDKAHLSHYTLGDVALEQEIISLFLVQLPTTVDLIRQAKTPAEWKLAAHTLKGAAAAVGAQRLRSIAADLELLSVATGSVVKERHLSALAEAIEEFRDVVRHIYP